MSHRVIVISNPFLELLEVLSTHPSHNLVAKFTWELHVDLTRKIGNLCGEHVCGYHSGVYFVALFAAVPRGLILHLLPALRAAIVDHFVVVFDGLHEPRDHVELRLLLY